MTFNILDGILVLGVDILYIFFYIFIIKMLNHNNNTGRTKMRNYKYINEWLTQRDIMLAPGFAEMLRGYMKDYKKSHNVKSIEIYSLLGCSKQNISYWEQNCDSTQSKKSVYGVIYNAAELFKLTYGESERLANSAGLSLGFEGGSLIEQLGYCGKVYELCSNAMISERMLRHYKKNSYKAGAYGYCNCLEAQH